MTTQGRSLHADSNCQEAPDDDEDSAAHQTLARMRYFLANVSGTMDRLSGGPPPKGVKPYDMHQLGLLEKHITDNILPVRDRLLAQMAAVEAIPDEDMEMVQVLATDEGADEGADAGQDAGVKSEEEDEGDAEQQRNDISDLFAPMDFLQAADDDAMAASSAPAEKLEPTDQPTGMFLGKRDVDGEVVGAGGVRVRKRPRSSLMPVLTKEREVWYECALCKEHYAATISCNPWWALVPRIDIALPVNGIDHAQVLSACADDSDMEGDTDGGYSSEEEDDDDELGEGAQLQAAQAAKLLVLMGHARECPGKHADPRHAEVCRSTKFLMLHIRDCNGLAPPTGDV
ncbi:hypothetical protein JKP88DRAFT_257864 [Tribonema minus]|uniref:Uncharacterized protein n=1 Tax=Tribonema minus TaxID=303371 RepID=A0A835YXC4_9STRA|nr:hypothetical protein JKP88DRAFT_257864 [Tribonema minus]